MINGITRLLDQWWDLAALKATIIALCLFLFGDNSALTVVAAIVGTSLVIHVLRQFQILGTRHIENKYKVLDANLKDAIWRYIAWMLALILAHQLSELGGMLSGFAAAMQWFVAVNEAVIAYTVLKHFGAIFPISLERYLRSAAGLEESQKEAREEAHQFTNDGLDSNRDVTQAGLDANRKDSDEKLAAAVKETDKHLNKALVHIKEYIDKKVDEGK